MNTQPDLEEQPEEQMTLGAPVDRPEEPPEYEPEYVRKDPNIPIQIELLLSNLGCYRSFKYNLFAYIGAAHPVYRYLPDKELPDKATAVTEVGLIDYQIGIEFKPNLGGRKWKMMVSVEPNDTYTVWLWKPIKPTRKKMKLGEVLDMTTHIHCDELQTMVEEMYDRWIETLSI